MLEVVIADMLDQQNKLIIPTIQSIKRTAKVIGDATVASSTAEFIKNYLSMSTVNNNGQLNNTYPNAFSNAIANKPPRYMPITGIYMLDGHANASGLLSMSFNPTTEVFTTEDSVRGLEQYFEDNSGVIWAVSNKVSYYGLWKRTGAGAWTQVLTDSAATGYLGKWTNGTLYYKSSTANWYSVVSGGANVSADPGGSYANWITLACDSNQNRLAMPGYYASATYPDVSYLNRPSDRDDASAYLEGSDYFWIWKWPDKTRQAVKNTDVYDFIANSADFLTASFYAQTIFVPIMGTNYVLQMVVSAPVSSTTLGTWLTVSCAIINLSTNQNQYLGSWRHPWVDAYGAMYKTASGYAQLVPRMAKLVNGVISLYYMGKPNNGTSLVNFGFVREDITARITV